MIKKVLVTLLVTVDTEDEEICPTGDPLAENVVINVLDDGFFSDPVEEIYTSHISDYVEHSKRVEKRIEDLYFNDPDYDNNMIDFIRKLWKSSQICNIMMLLY